jgi:hypothetical protein
MSYPWTQGHYWWRSLFPTWTDWTIKVSFLKLNMVEGSWKLTGTENCQTCIALILPQFTPCSLLDCVGGSRPVHRHRKDGFPGSEELRVQCTGEPIKSVKDSVSHVQLLHLASTTLALRYFQS